MRLYPLCLIALPWLGSSVLADSQPVVVSIEVPADAPAVASGVAPAAKPAPVVDEPAKIDGITIPRPNGHFLGLEVVDLRLRVTFYDAKKKPEVADAIRITSWWKKPKKQERERTVLTPETPERLVSTPVARAPHTYNVSLVLIGSNEKMMEQYIVNLGSGAITVGAEESSSD